MIQRIAGVLLLALTVGGCGGNGATKFGGPPPSTATAFGSCAFCHPAQATALLPTSAALKCEVCHADRLPGTVGPGHRAIPGPEIVPSFAGPSHALGPQAVFGSCAYCHNEFAKSLSPVGSTLHCQTCHDDLLPGRFGRGHQSRPGPDRVPDPAPAAHAVGPEGTAGSCAFCHNEFAISLLPVSNELHCQTCHDDLQPGRFGPGHQSRPGPDRVPIPAAAAHAVGPEGVADSCAFCHNEMAVSLLPFSNELHCQTCHDDLQPGHFGPGHRSRPGPDRVPAPPAAAHTIGAAAPLGSCAFCHNPFAVNLTNTSPDLKCEVCHGDRNPGVFGPAHRAIPGPELVPSFAGPAHALGAQAPFGSCAFCHNQFATSLTPVSSELHCQTCHDELQPGHFGPGHQSRPGTDRVPVPPAAAHVAGSAAPLGSCAFCHNQFATNMVPTSADLKCQACHADRRPGMFGAAHRALPGPELVPSFAGPTHALGDQARFGSCAFCHNQMAVNISASGTRDLQCQTCHQNALSDMFGPQHRSLPGPELVPSFVGPSHRLGPESHYGSCGFCHNELTVHALTSSGHGTLSLECANCHTEQPAPFGPMHQRVPACAECHSEPKTHHDPAVGTQSECAVCHEPHGSTNLFLVREMILTPSGVTRPVKFDNLLGLADGSFASVSDPGTGLCETCHTTTRHFRSDGSGLTHFPYACFTCHPHTLGFPAR